MHVFRNGKLWGEVLPKRWQIPSLDSSLLSDTRLAEERITHCEGIKAVTVADRLR